jgi:hypothetical protein
MRLSPRGKLAVQSSDPEHVIAVFSPLILACFTRVPRPEELAIVQARAKQAIQEGVRGGMLFVAARSNMSGGVAPHVRAFFEQMVRENSANSGGSAVVLWMDGFAGALVRSFLTGLLRISSQRQFAQIFGSVEEACAWLGPRHGLDAAALATSFYAATAHLKLPAAAGRTATERT